MINQFTNSANTRTAMKNKITTTKREESVKNNHQEEQEEHQKNDRSRSVNDFDTCQGLYDALNSQKKVSSYKEEDTSTSTTGGDIGDIQKEKQQNDDGAYSSSASTSTPPLKTAAASSCCSLYDTKLNTNLDWIITNANTESSYKQTVDGELKRLLVLRSYLVLDSKREESFERLTGLASRIFNVPICLVSLVDLGRQWFMSNRGLGDVRETPRKIAFCSHSVISKEDLLIVPDATKDVRFKDNPLVTGPPNIRFYAGAPLLCPEGYRLGTLCLIDSKTRPNGLSLDEKQNLRELAALVINELVQRREAKQREIQDNASNIASMANDLLTPLNGVQLSISMLLEEDSSKTKTHSTLSEQQKEMLSMANTCSNMMNDICIQTIQAFRDTRSMTRSSSSQSQAFQQLQHYQQEDSLAVRRSVQDDNEDDEKQPQHHEEAAIQQQEQQQTQDNNNNNNKIVIVSDMVKQLKLVMQHYPKSVPIYVTVDDAVPKEILLSDEIKIFRSAINYLTNACDKTKTGSIHLKIYITPKPTKPTKNKSATSTSHSNEPLKRKRDDSTKETNHYDKKSMLVFECEDCGPGVDVSKYRYLFRSAVNSDVDDYYDEGGGKNNIVDHGLCVSADPETGEMIKRHGLVQCTTTNNKSAGLGLYSVANAISSIGGRYGFRPRGQGMDNTQLMNSETGKVISGSIFWFSVPLILPPSLLQEEEQTGARIKSICMAAAAAAVDVVNDDIPRSKKNKVVPSQEHDASSVSTNSSSTPTSVDPTTKMEITNDVAGSADMQQQDEVERNTIDREVINKEEKEKLMENSSNLLKPTDLNVDISVKTTVEKEEKRLLRKRLALVIDDSVIIRKTIARALSKDGFEVTQAVNGMEGLKALQATVFDVVLCDFLMPVMDGLDCVQQYRAWEKKHRPWFEQYIIGISAHASGNDAEHGLNVGMNAFKSKPITLKTLQEIQNSEGLQSVRKKLDEAHKSDRHVPPQSHSRVRFRRNESESSFSSTSTFNDKVHRDQSGPVCLIAEDSTTVCRAMVGAIKREGWLTSTVSNGEDALRLLKMRRWDAVYIDEEMPTMTGVRCIERFRDWEKVNRVSRQNNVFLISGSYTPSPTNGTSTVFPNGFDGAIGKPLLLKDLMDSLTLATQTPCTNDILCR